MAAAPVVREIKIAAKPGDVFPYFTDPKKMVQWKGAQAELEPKPGGIYRVTINPKIVAEGTYVEIVPNRRVVFTWGWAGSEAVPPGSGTVTVDLEEAGDYTIVRLTHTGLPDEAAASEHTKGWDHYLARLSLAAVGSDPGPDPHEQAQ